MAIDLLWLDGESLLDVPLLERKRLLESVLDESELVRRGAFVRPPIETWIGSWRALGFVRHLLQGRQRPLPAGRHGRGLDASSAMPRR